VSNSGAVTLGDIAGRVTMLEIECAECGRFGRYRVDRLIEQHGANFGLPYLREILASGCPRQQSASIYERCAARFVNVPRP
jgi:hypothetical protein